MKDRDIAFERNADGEEALVVHNGLENINSPRVKSILNKMDNLSPELIIKLLTLDFIPDIDRQENFVDNGVKIEDLQLRLVNIAPYGTVEVSDVTLHKTAVPEKGDPDLGFHLKQNEVRGFEIIHVLEGEAVMSFPDNITPVAPGVYARSDSRKDIKLRKGDLAFLPAPTANGWTWVGEDFKFRYIGLPPWDKNLVAKTI